MRDTQACLSSTWSDSQVVAARMGSLLLALLSRLLLTAPEAGTWWAFVCMCVCVCWEDIVRAAFPGKVG